MFGETKKNLNIYAIISVLASVILGFAYMYLFCWYEIGVAHLVFYVAYVLFAIVGAVIVDRKEATKRISGWVIVLFLALFLSSAFVYRLNPLAILFMSLGLPVLYGVLLSFVFNPNGAKPAGLGAFLKAPFKMFGAWFMDIPALSRNVSFRFVKSDKSRSLLKRVFKGCFIALPFMFVFVILLSSADFVFQKFVGDLFGNLFSWLNSFDSLVNFIGKMIVGGIVSIYTMVYFFSLWNVDSQLAKDLHYEEPKEEGKSSKTWDIVTTSVFMGALNLIFVTFVLIQLRYLFGGDNNILGADAGFTYAEYARKGFFELLFVTASVFVITLVLNAKVYTANLTQKVVFRTNFIVMVFCALLLSISAMSRISLYESVYGFTILRLFVSFSIIVIIALFVLLLVSTLMKKSTKFMSIMSLVLFIGSFVIWSLVPTDYIVTRLNVDRFYETGRLDMDYVLNLSDEALPALIEMAQNPKTSAPTKNVLMKALSMRYEQLKEHRLNWQELNFVDQYNKLTLSNILKDGKDWGSEIDKDIESMIKDYESLLVQGKYEEAFSKYWSAGSKKNDLSKLHYEFVSYKKYSTYDYQYNSYDTGTISYTSLYSRYVTTRMSFYDTNFKPGVTGMQICRQESLAVVFEGGQWKIKSATIFDLGYPEFAGFDPLFGSYRTNVEDAPFSDMQSNSYFGECYSDNYR